MRLEGKIASVLDANIGSSPDGTAKLEGKGGFDERLGVAGLECVELARRHVRLRAGRPVS